ncbi:MAG TPA: branched-chain amino acid ABC transporter permease [Gaiellaceae bacterium]
MLPLAFDWTTFGQFTVDGLTLGSVYALIALGYSMVYGILKLLNFAHGDVYMVGAFIGYYVLTAFGGSLHATANVTFIIVAMFAAAMIGCGVLGVGIERFAYRPLRNAPRIAPLISALGVSFFLENAAIVLFGGRPKDYDIFDLGGNPQALIPGPLFKHTLEVGGVRISLVRIIVIVTAAALMVMLALLVKYSRLGKAMRATAFDREAASMMGIDVDRVIMATFFIGSALAGAGGVMVGLFLGKIDTFMGFIAGLKAFTAAVVGGIGSIPGAMLGGLLIGLAEAYAIGYAPQGSTFVDLYVFALLIIVLIIRPRGLLGAKAIQKV